MMKINLNNMLPIMYEDDSSTKSKENSMMKNITVSILYIFHQFVWIPYRLEV